MKVYGWRHKQDKSCVWLCNNKDGAGEMLRAWLANNHIDWYLDWAERHKYFEEIEAELTYEDEGF